MTDTRTLLNKLHAFRQRLDSMPRLVAEKVVIPAAAAPGTPLENLQAKVSATSRTQALLEESIRHLGQEPAPEAAPSIHLLARAKRVLGEARELIECLRQLADDVALAGPPPEQASDQADPLVIFYRETAAMMAPAVRMAQNMPDAPSVQARLAEGLEGFLGTVRQRLAALGHALEQRRRDAEQVDRLAHILFQLTSQECVQETQPILQLAAEVLAEGPAVPMRFLDAPPAARQAFLGGPEFPAPIRFVAAHSLTTARVAARMLRQAPLWRGRPLDVIVAALLHDVGMVRVPVDVLASTGPLTEDQRRAVESHPGIGSQLLAAWLPGLGGLPEIVSAHHERMDGTGYPRGLKSDQIPEMARLIAAADMYAALCCRRPQRPARDPRTALTDTLLYGEQNIVDRFAAEKLLALSFYPVGSVVEMSDGAIGVVAANRPGRDELHLASRPVLNLLIDAQGRLLPVPMPVDLAECEGGAVVRTLPAEERGRLLGRHYPEWAA